MSHESHTPQGHTSLKYIALVTPALLLVLLAGAVLFYKERMLYIDAPHILFRIINDGHFWIEQHRYGSFISQILPLAGAKLHLPLAWLMILYSAGFYLFYFVVSLVLFFRFKNHGLTILLGLYFTVFVSSAFYWPNNEVHQGITWLLLAFAINFSVAAKTRRLFITSILFAASFFLAIWTHPLVMLAAIYLWFFLMAEKAWPYTKTQTIVFSIILLLLSYIKFYQGTHDWYDGGKIEAVTQFQLKQIKTVIASPQLRFFVGSCIHQYELFSLLLIAGIVGLLKEKKYLLLIWTLLFVSGYLLLTCITFRDVASRDYMESEYMPLVIICCAPFVYYVLPKMKMRWGVVLIIVIYISRLAAIYFAAAPYTNRVTIMNKINEQMAEKGLTKVIIPEPVAGIDSALILNWGAPVESIYISKLKGETPQRTFIFLNADQIKAGDTITKYTLLGCFERRDISHINAHYFRLDTTVAYKIMTYTALMQ